MEIYCQNSNCMNYKVSPNDLPNSLYVKTGTTKSGFQIYKCKSCNQTFKIKNFNLHGNLPNPKLNTQVLRLLLAGKSINDICKMMNISSTSFYNRVEYIRSLLVDYEKLKSTENLKAKPVISEVIKDKYIIVEYEKNSLYLTKLRVCEHPNKCSLEGLSPSIEEEIKALSKLSMFKSSRHICGTRTADLILEVFRICHNFSIFKNQAQDPPAVRLGSVEHSVSLQELLSLEL